VRHIGGDGHGVVTMTRCVPYKCMHGMQRTTCVHVYDHVDDHLNVCELEDVFDSVHGQLQYYFMEVRLEVLYLGHCVDFYVPGKAICTMEGYLHDSLEGCRCDCASQYTSN